MLLSPEALHNSIGTVFFDMLAMKKVVLDIAFEGLWGLNPIPQLTVFTVQVLGRLHRNSIPISEVRRGGARVAHTFF